MPETSFKVEQIDHIHVYVSDQYKAAAWYEEILGLKIIPEYEDWAADGPLVISSDEGNTSLALFRKNGDWEERSTIAFRVHGDDFLLFLERLEQYEVFDRNGNRIKKRDAVDHEKAYSIYFCDADKNPIELTTYDYQTVFDRLNR